MSTTTQTAPVPSEVEDIQRRAAAFLAEYAAVPVEDRSFLDSHHRRMEALRDELDAVNASLPAPVDCPSWCNAHHAGYALHSEDNVMDGPHCRRQAQGDNWYFDIDESNDPELGRITFAPMEYRELTLEQARAYAVAVLAALDAVEGAK
ncbi:hypothetical protein [Phycicoccus avicenniae]|uniref:hypothetical protein n=1 Tax=Phycicoccus avicenniae TaxID=2828860 RepID=UPI003D267778